MGGGDRKAELRQLRSENRQLLVEKRRLEQELGAAQAAAAQVLALLNGPLSEAVAAATAAEAGGGIQPKLVSEAVQLFACLPAACIYAGIGSSGTGEDVRIRAFEQLIWPNCSGRLRGGLLIHTPTAAMAHRVARFVVGQGLACGALTEDLSSEQIERTASEFRSGKLKALVCSEEVEAVDLLTNAKHIVFMQPPRDPELYVQLVNQQSVTEAFEVETLYRPAVDRVQVLELVGKSRANVMLGAVPPPQPAAGTSSEARKAALDAQAAARAGFFALPPIGPAGAAYLLAAKAQLDAMPLPADFSRVEEVLLELLGDKCVSQAFLLDIYCATEASPDGASASAFYSRAQNAVQVLLDQGKLEEQLPQRRPGETDSQYAMRCLHERLLSARQQAQGAMPAGPAGAAPAPAEVWQAAQHRAMAAALHAIPELAKRA
ncbi:hypothetical protein COHA_003900 [Chlorella ohadii]|uniref:Helicase C-terminal domain-containing protein n=1 Tax=Chlorella ohadii TaxID=2649997 RepID=A0AAD5DTS1_9CHLO|nr:hypothetical protein COHA_003900 [Chlorella ohadii]